MKLSDITVTDIESVFTVHSTRGRRLDMKDRKNYGLSFCTGGRIDYIKDGKRTVSDSSCAVILPKGTDYLLLGTETGDFPLINFEVLEPFTSDLICIRLRNPESYMRDLERMNELCASGQNRAKLMSLMYGILERLSAETDRTHPAISRSISYFSSNIGDPSLSIADAAAHAEISEVYLRKLFVSELGYTPKQYVMELRLRRARHMLAEKAETVTSVAESCGFSSVYHFCRAFKKSTGMTPSEYARLSEHNRG